MTVLSRDAKARFGDLPGETEIDACHRSPVSPATWLVEIISTRAVERDPPLRTIEVADGSELDNIGRQRAAGSYSRHAKILNSGYSPVLWARPEHLQREVGSRRAIRGTAELSDPDRLVLVARGSSPFTHD